MPLRSSMKIVHWIFGVLLGLIQAPCLPLENTARSLQLTPIHQSRVAARVLADRSTRIVYERYVHVTSANVSLVKSPLELDETLPVRHRYARSFGDQTQADGVRGKGRLQNLHVVSCQMDVACDPDDPGGHCTCPKDLETFGEAKCIIPKARISHISMSNSGPVKIFCVGVTLNSEESDIIYDMHTRCKYLGGNNVKYRVYITKTVETSDTNEDKVKYRACLEPVDDR
ncbi:uncharacterized protein [Branchiostoma lanceolatum]|uniref:Hypp5932 protein n=1 Tax=Branchiostoma lanceolatum TaxID=7740 RepID=A0A8J9W861_BRALA|nr:Hypp5932 [Branchiostoma lanceolatum]